MTHIVYVVAMLILVLEDANVLNDMQDCIRASCRGDVDVEATEAPEAAEAVVVAGDGVCCRARKTGLAMVSFRLRPNCRAITLYTRRAMSCAALER